MWGLGVGAVTKNGEIISEKRQIFCTGGYRMVFRSAKCHSISYVVVISSLVYGYHLHTLEFVFGGLSRRNPEGRWTHDWLVHVLPTRRRDILPWIRNYGLAILRVGDSNCLVFHDVVYLRYQQLDSLLAQIISFIMYGFYSVATRGVIKFTSK